MRGPGRRDHVKDSLHWHRKPTQSSLPPVQIVCLFCRAAPSRCPERRHAASLNTVLRHLHGLPMLAHHSASVRGHLSDRVWPRVDRADVAQICDFVTRDSRENSDSSWTIAASGNL